MEPYYPTDIKVLQIVIKKRNYLLLIFFVLKFNV